MRINLSTLFGMTLIASHRSQELFSYSDSRYLVAHDNKPKEDLRAGYTLPRLGVVDIDTGHYQTVLLPDDDLLKRSRDLESLTWLFQNEYLTCESTGGCYHIDLTENAGEYTAATLQTFQLPVPKDKFFNIEGMALAKIDSSTNVICYDHRGGIHPGEEPWSRCASYDIYNGEIGRFEEALVADPFAIPNPLNRAISDHAIGEQTGQSYFVATIDTEGSEGIAATLDKAYSFIYTKDQCIKYIDQDKVEALYITPDETTAIIATDNDRPNSEKVCQFSLFQPMSATVCHSVPYGIGGIAPIKQNAAPSPKREKTSLIKKHSQGIHLREILQAYCEKLFGSVTNEMLDNFVMILLEGGAFTEITLPENAPQRAKDHARVAQTVWKKVMGHNHSNEFAYSAYVHQGLMDVTPDIIENILALSFPSYIDALNWLRAITQIKHLRGSFFSEGFKGDLKINIARWQHDSVTMSDLDASKQESWQRALYKHYAKLQLVDTVAYPESWFNNDGHDRSVVIHGVVSPYLDSRIDFLAPFQHGQVKVYYLTNPRGIFNYEHLADILAKTWFDNPELTPIIQTVLNKPEHKDCWLGNITAVKRDILSALDIEHWPEGRGAWYNANKPEGNIYQIAVEAEGNKRQSLKDWPVIEDLILFLFEKKKVANPGQFDNVAIEMVLTRVEGRVANTKDTLEYLRQMYPEAIARGAIFISDNLSHNILKQDLEAVKVLGRDRVLATVGASSDILEPKQARDALAKVIFEHFGDVEHLLNTREAKKVSDIRATLFSVSKTPEYSDYLAARHSVSGL